jgi:homoserine O-acetyltransferase
MEKTIFSSTHSGFEKNSNAPVIKPSTGSTRKDYDPPDSLRSVGMTRPQQLVLADEKHPFRLDSGKFLAPMTVEYETYGELNADRSNAILITHALSGDAHVAGWDAAASPSFRPWRLRRPGWWDEVVGPSKAIDSSRFFVICANVLGSCYGTTGPSSINPATNRPYGLDFPIVTVGDWVRMEALLLDKLGIRQLYAVCGGSLGGQQALEWALAFPDRVLKCIVLASGPKLPAQGLGFNAVGRHAIMHDRNFDNGNYYGKGHQPPHEGLIAARMLAHITYLSGQGMDSKFGRRVQNEHSEQGGFDAEFAVESYLNYQGRSFVERFDANSYLYITRAMDYYDAAAQWGGGDLVAACSRIRAEVLVVSFSSDWLYPPEESRVFVSALMRNRIPVTYVQIESNYGHDAFLVEADKVGRLLRAFLLSPTIARRFSEQSKGGTP